ncbi:Asp-tRNA(Asn)/Glu-tRNA(Gln) amidotransferase subunit GatC [Ferrovum sp. PN-J185]|uniref:Asp-tRNA(Asn)/Glu-tRNA(Gln) amidotransferase subunit GatC n=1 Tax=Ferrovum sp. PN-J185 TaxID=1356306 RepID=UPI000792B5AC|nr:Asp-tRNA(Asn)/Glu-tRNA(Gln) amidotransferase subunit GatC [Ferrovum sp. PN-J185]KXW55611.1 glutamyl-tRNA(Gln) amidotransferase subunit C [Ferrovum sp. PN-J185]MCC6068886.1 Asp-tRNA(Asn)/Glu-tRNA(Gln) amidotransferase subunit GatC [Ferrovum sp. PN-J185]MDE1891178.1 Asp-tRNA(Asn)/Glu-tRNA(Gln) amidotransferase subunit GatC [Betaproteobacteria bacterium]MDE2056218.1 Asp-tRNA(Asn)/Glu-tRNA(Gln) amidotransferase subunit GatC [Betaproteobacteria bacterium]
MSLTDQEIKHLAKLARIHIEDTELTLLRDQLAKVFQLIDTLQAVDTAGIEPLSHSLALSQPLREDRVTEPNLRDMYQAVAPEVEKGLYIVPKVIE